MIFHCKATLHTEDLEEKVRLYHKEYAEYEQHKAKMENDSLYSIQNGDTLIEEPIAPKPKTGFVKCNFRKEHIVGYESAGKVILLLIDFSKTGQGSYIIKYDDKVIKELDALLD